MRLKKLPSTSALLSIWFALASARTFSGGAIEGFEEAANFQAEQIENLRSFLGPKQEDSSTQNVKRESAITFRNPNARQFFVDGTKIPDGASTTCDFRSKLTDMYAVNFDAGPSYSGLMPISPDPKETRKLFFW